MPKTIVIETSRSKQKEACAPPVPECKLSKREIERFSKELTKYMKQFAPAFERIEQVKHSYKRKMVQEFLAVHKRLYMFYFPVAAPELNPAEFIWTQTAEYTAGTAPHNGTELQRNIFSAIARIRLSQNRLQACILGSRLDWFK